MCVWSKLFNDAHICYVMVPHLLEDYRLLADDRKMGLKNLFVFFNYGHYKKVEELTHYTLSSGSSEPVDMGFCLLKPRSHQLWICAVRFGKAPGIEAL